MSWYNVSMAMFPTWEMVMEFAKKFEMCEL